MRLILPFLLIAPFLTGGAESKKWDAGWWLSAERERDECLWRAHDYHGITRLHGMPELHHQAFTKVALARESCYLRYRLRKEAEALNKWPVYPNARPDQITIKEDSN